MNPTASGYTWATQAIMAYPAAGVPCSTGSAWGSSSAVGTEANNLVQLTGSGRLPAVDGSQLTNLINIGSCNSVKPGQLAFDPNGWLMHVNPGYGSPPRKSLSPPRPPLCFSLARKEKGRPMRALSPAYITPSGPITR